MPFTEYAADEDTAIEASTRPHAVSNTVIPTKSPPLTPGADGSSRIRADSSWIKLEDLTGESSTDVLDGGKISDNSATDSLNKVNVSENSFPEISERPHNPCSDTTMLIAGVTSHDSSDFTPQKCTNASTAVLPDDRPSAFSKFKNTKKEQSSVFTFDESSVLGGTHQQLSESSQIAPAFNPSSGISDSCTHIPHTDVTHSTHSNSAKYSSSVENPSSGHSQKPHCRRDSSWICKSGGSDDSDVKCEENKEDIPLTPGTVQRTRQEIEERQR